MYPNTECPHDCYKHGDCDGSCTHPARANPADAFRNVFAILHNTSLADLNRAQVITDGNPLNNKQWDRFNDDLTTFVLKLDDARLDALYALVQSRQPEWYRDAA